MDVTHRLCGGVTLVVLLGAVGSCGSAPPATERVPAFEVDPTWPQELPNDWIMGRVTGLHVDSRDHIWLVHQPAILTPQEIGAAQDPPIAECCVPAPPVLVFDREGSVVQAWDGPGEGYVWPPNVHGVYVDHNDYVWIGSNEYHQVLKFTLEGEHVLTIGDPETSGGSNDPNLLGGPAGFYVDPETNELFVADGYRNHRVIVFDAETGEYLRHWGAYGERPDDDYERPSRGIDGPPSQQFSTVHAIAGSDDGLLYVADRSNNRIQVFRHDGEYVTERIIAPATLASGSAFSLAFSSDPQQEFLYLADGTNHKVWILRREGLEIVGEFGHPGHQVGQFLRPHNLAVDSDGNVYVGEAASGNRVQRFTRPGTESE